MKTYFQPMLRSIFDSEHDSWWMPIELSIKHVFASRKDAEQFIAEKGYSKYKLMFIELSCESVGDLIVLDGHGKAVKPSLLN